MEKTTTTRSQVPHVQVDIGQGLEGADFRPQDVTVKVGSILIWSNQTSDSQVFQLGRRTIALAPRGEDGAVGMTRIPSVGLSTHRLRSNPSSHVTITASADDEHHD